MDYSFRNSTGSTVSEVFNAVLNSPLPIEFIYISHPFGTSSISPTSDKPNINGNNNKWAISSTKPYIDFNFDYMKYIQNIQKISNTNNFKKNISTENLCNFNNIFSEHGQYKNKNNNLNNQNDIYDGFPKLILNTIRKAWISPDHKKNTSNKVSTTNCPNNMQFNNNDNEKRIKTFSTFNASSQEKQLIRRYSVPEIEIRKYEINQNTDLYAFYKNFHKLEKPQNLKKKNNKIKKKDKIDKKDSTNIKLNNLESDTVKPIKMEKNEKRLFQKQETTESDIFVSELLIKIHKEDFAIADLLIENLNDFLTQKNSSLYVTPEAMEEISSRGKTYEQTIEIPESIYIAQFDSEETNYTNRTSSNDATIGSVDSLESSSNNNNKISLGIQVFPELLENPNECEQKSKLNEYARNPKVFQKKKIISPTLNNSTKKSVRKTSASKSSKNTVINSLQAYKFDSRGNLQFSSASSMTAFLPNVLKGSSSKKVVAKKFNSSKSSSTTTSKSSFRSNAKFKKFTMFEGQNQSTPDVEMGPKRFYQKTEIFDGDNKIDILEIIECLQASPPQRPDPLNSFEITQPFSKIPIRINRFNTSFNINLNKKLKPNSGKRKSAIIKVRPNFLTGHQKKQIIPIQVENNETKNNDLLSNLKAFPKLNEINNFDRKKKVVKNENLKNKNDNIKLQPIKDPLSTTTTVTKPIKIDNDSARAQTTPTSFEQTISVPSSCTALRGSSSNSLPSTILPKVISPCDHLLTSVTNNNNQIFQTMDNRSYNDVWRIPSADYCDTNTNYKKIETMQLSLPLSSCKSTSSICCKCESPVIDLNHASPPSVSVCSICSLKITPRCFIDNFFDSNTSRLFSHHGFQNECRLLSCSKRSLDNRNYNMCTCIDCKNSFVYSNISSKSSCKQDIFQLHDKNRFHSTPKITENNIKIMQNETINDWKLHHSKIKPITNLNKNSNKIVTSSNNETKSDKLRVTSATLNKNVNQDENPVWHITVSGPPDFKMELSFSKDSKNVDIEQTINGVSSKIEPNISISNKLDDDENHDITANIKQEECAYKKSDICNCSVNLINFPSFNSPMTDLSVLGNTICPEKKPKPPTMSERDLTRRKNHNSRLNI